MKLNRQFLPYYKRRLSGKAEAYETHINWAIIASYVGLVLTAGSLYFTSDNLKESEKWNKASFIANQFEKFSNDTAVNAVTHFLDYESSYLKIKNKNKIFDKDYVGACLLPDSLSDGVNPADKAEIRSYFDNYLDKLSLFNRYYKAKLMSFDDIKPYLDYQILLIIRNDDRHACNFHNDLVDYIHRWHFTDVEELLKLFASQERLIKKGATDYLNVKDCDSVAYSN